MIPIQWSFPWVMIHDQISWWTLTLLFIRWYEASSVIIFRFVPSERTSLISNLLRFQSRLIWNIWNLVSFLCVIHKKRETIQSDLELDLDEGLILHLFFFFFFSSPKTVETPHETGVSQTDTRMNAITSNLSKITWLLIKTTQSQESEVSGKPWSKPMREKEREEREREKKRPPTDD